MLIRNLFSLSVGILVLCADERRDARREGRTFLLEQRSKPCSNETFFMLGSVS